MPFGILRIVMESLGLAGEICFQRTSSKGSRENSNTNTCKKRLLGYLDL